MLVDKIRRWIPKNNIKYLPQPEARIIKYGGIGERKGRVLCEIDFTWIRNNGPKYERLFRKR